jgi:nucleotide-binding universal stress UspA family protein
VADLDKLAQELTDPGHGPADGLDVTTAVFMGGPSTAILERASDTDLIVMASHGRGGVTRFALGSITDAVIRGSGKPVMVVPRRES